MDKDPKKALQDVMESLKVFALRMEENREKRLWREVDMPCTLSNAINRLSKDEMHKIRKNLDLKNLSALKKVDLAAELVKKIPGKFKQVVSRLDQGRYGLVKNILQNSGFIIDRGISVSNAETLLGYSIIFPGMHNNQKVLFMPSELVQVFMEIDGPDLEKRVKLNTEWILLTQGMLFYYGVMAEVLIMERIKQLTGKDVDIAEYLNVMAFAMDFHGQVKYSPFGLKDHRVSDAKKIVDEHRMRAGVDYYPFSKKELLKTGVAGYVDNSPAMNNFIGFLLEHYELDKEETDEIALQLINIINADGKQADILEYMQNWLEMPSFDFAQLLTSEITELCNNTRQWILKGHTPEELFQEEKKFLKPLPSKPFVSREADSNVIDLKTRKKIGRNDPCPCGSGKKYKKCCGK